MKGEGGLNVMVVSLVVAVVGLSLYAGRTEAAVTLPPDARMLRRHYYKKLNTCRSVEPYVRHQVQLWWNRDRTITAKLLKLLYADCMVNGCDGSILLDGPQVEKRARQNLGLGGFMLIDKIKKVLEIRCPRAVSCADILNLAVRDAVNLAGAPSYPVLLGRRDGLDSNVAWVDLPTRSISVEDGLAYFRSKGLDSQDYATLLGAHTLGKTHCAYIRDRLYNFQKTGKPDPSMKPATLETLRQACKEEPDKTQEEEATVFLTTSEANGDRYRFTNRYYGNVVAHDTVLRVDEELMLDGNTSQIVLDYAGRFDLFKKEFALSVSRMGSLKVLTGEQGEVRLNCRYTNKNNPYVK